MHFIVRVVVIIQNCCAPCRSHRSPDEGCWRQGRIAAADPAGACGRDRGGGRQHSRVSSAHFNFLEEEAWRMLQGGKACCCARTSSFTGSIAAMRSFEDFLGALASRKRKMLRRERREAQEGLEIIRRHRQGAHGPGTGMRSFKFYMDTGGRKWGSPYLNREFFALLHSRMADKCMLVLADGWQETRLRARFEHGRLGYAVSGGIGAARWTDRFLHFEICYYQAIDFAIERGLARVEAGAQGEHKLSRGV